MNDWQSRCLGHLNRGRLNLRTRKSSALAGQSLLRGLAGPCDAVGPCCAACGVGQLAQNLAGTPTLTTVVL